VTFSKEPESIAQTTLDNYILKDNSLAENIKTNDSNTSTESEIQLSINDDTKVSKQEEVKKDVIKQSQSSNSVHADSGKGKMAYLRSNKDLVLKLLASRLFTNMGYTTFCETMLPAYTYGKSYRRGQVSDIDVFAIRYEPDLSFSSIAVECKSGNTDALDNLLKLDGICRFKGTSRGVLIQNKIPPNAREVADTLGVTTWDENELKKLLICYDIWQDNLSDNLIDEYIKKVEHKKVANKDFPKMCKFLDEDYWVNPENRNIQSIIAILIQSGGKLSKENLSHLYMLDEAVLLLSVSILRAGSYIIRNNLSQPVDRLKDFLFGGARERREREILFDKINQQIGGSNSFLPAYFNNLAELVVRYVSTPSAAKDVPKLWSCMIDARLRSEKDWGAFIEKCDPMVLKLTKDLLRFISKCIKNQPEHWSLLIHM
jgi:hypothetical protein